MLARARESSESKESEAQMEARPSLESTLTLWVNCTRGIAGSGVVRLNPVTEEEFPGQFVDNAEDFLE
jgi:hypothetical protein